MYSALPPGIRRSLKLEELAEFGIAVYGYHLLGLPLWTFFALLLAPDLSMVGYLAGPRVGAALYNTFHHKGLALLTLAAGLYTEVPVLAAAGLILFAHAAMDRMLGYGLKLPEGFRHTHLGMVGKDKPAA